jgi:spore coat protein U-like protein
MSIPSCYTTGPFPISKAESVTKTLYAKILTISNSPPPGTYTDSYTGTQATVNNWGAGSFNCGGHYAPTPFTLTMTIAPSCIVSATDLVFPSSGFITTAVDGAASISVTCTNTTPYSVGLSNGAGAGATFVQRKMTSSSGNTVNYNLFSDVARTAVWADGFFQALGFRHGLAAVAHGLWPRARADDAPAGRLPGHGGDHAHILREPASVVAPRRARRIPLLFGASTMVKGALPRFHREFPCPKSSSPVPPDGSKAAFINPPRAARRLRSSCIRIRNSAGR